MQRIRTCVGCGEKEGKTQLVRIVKTAEQRIVLDLTGRTPGRGAYVCSKECFEKARKTNRLAQALKYKVTDEQYDEIAQAMLENE